MMEMLKYVIAILVLSLLSGCGGGTAEDAKTALSGETTSESTSQQQSSSKQFSNSSKLNSSSKTPVASSSIKATISSFNYSSSSYQSESNVASSFANSSISISSSGIETLREKPTQPGKPNSLGITPRSITLSWEPSISQSGILEYRIFRNGMIIATLDGTQTQFENKPLVPQDTYTYYIISVDNENGVSLESERSTFATPVEVSNPLSSAGSPGATNSTSSLSVSSTTQQSKSSLQSTSAAGSMSSVRSASTVSSARSSVITSVRSSLSSNVNSLSSSSKSSEFSVASSSGSSYASSASSALDVTAPTKPTNLQVTNITQTNLLLKWNASIDSAGVAKYDVFRNGSKVATVASTNLTYSDSGLTAGIIYKYKVRSLDSAGNFSDSDELITSTTALSDPTTSTVSWNHPTSREDGTPMAINEIGGYEIRYKKAVDNVFTYIQISGYSITEFKVPVAKLEIAVIEIAAYDTNGLYSKFITAERVASD